MATGWKQLPDGSWLNQATGVVTASLVDDYSSPPKTRPSPPSGSRGTPLTAPNINQQASAISGMAHGAGMPGMGVYGTGPMALQMRQGRNYPAMGGLPVSSKVLAIGAVIGIAALTVYLQQSKKSKA
jgi:hypothetical protein